MAVKFIEDIVPNTVALLSEMHTIIDKVAAARAWVQPSDSPEAAREGNPAKYVVKARTMLQHSELDHFEQRYPALSAFISDGDASDSCASRLIDGVYKVGSLAKQLTEARYMLKTDEERAKADALCCTIIGDLAIFAITQFKLGRTDDKVYLGVHEFCEKQGYTEGVLYGAMLNAMSDAGQAPYGYEEISPYHDDLVDIDGSFVSEAEEALFPLTEEICKGIIAGEITIPAARGMVADYVSQTDVQEVKNITPLNMVKRMELGGK